MSQSSKPATAEATITFGDKTFEVWPCTTTYSLDAMKDSTFREHLPLIIAAMKATTTAPGASNFPAKLREFDVQLTHSIGSWTKPVMAFVTIAYLKTKKIVKERSSSKASPVIWGRQTKAALFGILNVPVIRNAVLSLQPQD